MRELGGHGGGARRAELVRIGDPHLALRPLRCTPTEGIGELVEHASRPVRSLPVAADGAHDRRGIEAGAAPDVRKPLAGLGTESL